MLWCVVGEQSVFTSKTAMGKTQNKRGSVTVTATALLLVAGTPTLLAESPPTLTNIAFFLHGFRGKERLLAVYLVRSTRAGTEKFSTINVIVDTCCRGPKLFVLVYRGASLLRSFGYYHPSLILIWYFASYQSNTAVMTSSPLPVLRKL